MKTRLLFGSSLAIAATLSGCFDSHSVDEEKSTPKTDTPAAPRVRDTLPIRISEICPGNATLADQFGEDPGWLELENTSKDTVDLSRLRLRGRAKDGPGWILPKIKLAPGARQVIFASGRDLSEERPAQDSIVPTITGSFVWADSDNDPPGLSKVTGWEFGQSKLTGKLPNGSNAYSWTIHLADNSSTKIAWSSAEADIFFAPLDLNKHERAWFIATIPSGQPIKVSLCQNGTECWKAPQIQLMGTGRNLDRYEIPLSDFGGDRSRTNGLRFSPPANLIGDFKITLAQGGFFKSARHPHANFKLQREGAMLVLEDTTGSACDSVVYPELLAGASWSRDRSSGKWSLVDQGTPGGENPAFLHASILVAPKFSTAPGFHSSPFAIRVEPLAGYQVRCALGGAHPTATSPLADSGIALDSSTTASCAAFSVDGEHGPVSTGTFLLDTPRSLGVIAITVDSASMFSADSGLTSMGPNAAAAFPYFGANFWMDKELPAHVEMFDGGKRVFANHSGISIFGNYSRANAKKSFSVQFREKYGANNIQYPLFPHHPQFTKFKGFGLRNNGGNYGQDYVRDALMASLTEPRGQDYQLSRHVVVYINGKYWGIYDLREKLDADWVNTRLGIDPGTIDLIKNNTEVQAGSIADWNDLRSTIDALRPDDEAGWTKIASRLDIDNTMDYLATELYWQNTDWPSNNSRCWRQNSPASPWRMMVFDMDFGMGSYGGYYDENPFIRLIDSSLSWDEYPNGQGSTVIARRIFGRKVLRDRFLNRMLAQMATNFSPTNALRAYDSIRSYLNSEVPLDVTRWKLNTSNLAANDRTIREFIKKRGPIVRENMALMFKLAPERTINLTATGGTILIEDMPVGESYSYPHFDGVPIQIEAMAPRGRAFAGWSDGVATAKRTLIPGTDSVTIEAKFR